MEDTLKSGGVDTDAARKHFDDLEKANLGSTPEEWDAGYEQHTGQVKGRAQEGGNPSTNAIGKTTGSGGKVEKSDFVTGASDADIESAYEVYKAAAPLSEIQKSIEALGARIDELATPSEGGEIRKSESEPSVVVPSTEDLANMTWEEVHNLASKTFE